jgi:MFS family permease
MIGTPIIILTLLSVAIYSFTLAPVLWVILSEIFPNHLRGAAMSLAAVMHWVGNFSLTFTFPAIQASLGWTLNFWLYGVICVVGFIIVAITLVETKGKSLEQIEFELIGKKIGNITNTSGPVQISYSLFELTLTQQKRQTISILTEFKSRQICDANDPTK